MTKENKEKKFSYELLGTHIDGSGKRFPRGSVMQLTLEEVKASCFKNKLKRIIDDSQSSEILSKATTQAEEQASKIVNDAEKQAEKTIKQAAKKAEEILTKAKEMAKKAEETMKKAKKAEKKEKTPEDGGQGTEKQDPEDSNAQG